MAKKFVLTCYGCCHFYTDKGDKWPRKHCDIVDHWNSCEIWKQYLNKED